MASSHYQFGRVPSFVYDWRHITVGSRPAAETRQLGIDPSDYGAPAAHHYPALSADLADVIGSRSTKVASAAAMAYHGYARNNSAIWALAWAAFGYSIPILSVPISLAQGFGKRKVGCR